MPDMTKATDVITANANLENSGEAADLFISIGIAVGLVLDENAEWEDMPAGIGSAIIEFARSEFYKSTQGERRTYGIIGQEYLAFCMSKYAKSDIKAAA
jgi:hypothetical protein